LNDVEQSVLGAIESLPTDIDAVIARSGLPVPRVLSTLSVLELRGFIVRSGGRSVARRH
ncbi:MAG: DNA-protecting protein DprA, partial [Planctomycetota bacterium]